MTTYDKLVTSIEAKNRESKTTANRRRMIKRLQNGSVSSWEAICRLTPIQEPVPAIDEFRNMQRGNGQVIG